MNDHSLSTPQVIMARLEELDRDLAARGPALEAAARAWFIQKRDRDRRRAEVFLTSEGTVAERNAHADLATSTMGAPDEAAYEALKAVCRTIETRVGIGQSLLRAHGRS